MHQNLIWAYSTFKLNSKATIGVVVKPTAMVTASLAFLENFSSYIFF